MEGSPARIDVARVSERLLHLDGVKGVHDLHVWTVTSGFDSLTCHLTVEDDRPSYPILNEAIRLLHDEFGISHVTIQIEDETVRHAELACEHGGSAKVGHAHGHSHS
jgi:cobalt-zinc-cadmium efflux system protein